MIDPKAAGPDDAGPGARPILEGDDLDSLLLAHDRGFNHLLAQARERVRAGRYLTNEQFWRELRRRQTRRGTPRPSARSARTTSQKAR
jgi:hypothetical protein